jgi:Cytochrome c7 and related cytochrome c
MTGKVLPVAGGIAVLAVVGVAFYAALQPVPAQQSDQPPERFIAPVDVDTVGLPGPVQPIFYRHDVHAGQYEMDCRYCHYAAEVSSSPGLPSLDSCMGCHLLVGGANPEVAKVREAFTERRPIEWVEVHRLPSFVRFPHMRHVVSDAEITCQDCHGEVQRMPQVYQFSSLTMGWCLECHKKEEATTDCTACHY